MTDVSQRFFLKGLHTSIFVHEFFQMKQFRKKWQRKKTIVSMYGIFAYMNAWVFWPNYCVNMPLSWMFFHFFFSLEDQIRPVAQKLFRMPPKKNRRKTVGRLKVLLVLCDPLSRLASGGRFFFFVTGRRWDPKTQF